MNNLELKALRQALGLTVLDASELAGVSKRSFQYWESGKHPIKSDFEQLLFVMVSHYSMILRQMTEDLDRVTVRQYDDDTKPTIVYKPALPFFHSFEDFQMKTGCKWVSYWRIYQAVIGQLLMSGKVTKLDDSAEIPSDFKIWRWFAGEYEHQD